MDPFGDDECCFKCESCSEMCTEFRELSDSSVENQTHDVHDDIEQRYSFELCDEVKRINLRECNIITIDSDNASILEDAIHIEKGDNNVIEIGVHCIDIDAYHLDDNLLEQAEEKKIGGGGGENALFPLEVLNKLKLTSREESLCHSLIFYFDMNEKKIMNMKYFKSIIMIKAQVKFTTFSMLCRNTSIKSRQLNELKLFDITLNKVSEICNNLVDFTKEFFKDDKMIQQQDDDIDGSVIMKVIGNYLNMYIGKSLHEYYGEDALTKTNCKGTMYTTFKSPLRKCSDIFALRQIACMFQHDDVNQMCKIVMKGDASAFPVYLAQYKQAK